MKNYPIGIQSFEKLIEDDYLYIDKTEKIFSLIQSGQYFFLSRPRRFGKSMLLSTLKAIFEGKKELFKGLWIENKIDWSVHNVVHISFSSIGFQNLGLEKAIHHTLQNQAEQFGLTLTDTSYDLQFQELLKKLYEKTKKKTVILIDEYDTPIVHYLGDDLTQAKRNRDILKSFYSVIKDADPYIQFFLITGISKFSKVSIFSTLNNLLDISLSSEYAAICGITHEEMLSYFSNRIKSIAHDMNTTETLCIEKIKFWYNGFCFSRKSEPTLYSPFSLLVFMQSGEFSNYWFETGTPTFLVTMLRDDFEYDLDGFEMDEMSLKSYDLEHLDYRAILFQTGYITIKKYLGNNYFLMGYPNEEVRESMLKFLLSEFMHVKRSDPSLKVFDLKKTLEKGDLHSVIEKIDLLFAAIPADLFKQKYENFYHAIIFMAFRLLGVQMQCEVQHRGGSIDAVVETDKYIYIFEFKVTQSALAALKQIKDNNYHKPYLDKEKTLFLVGVKFSSRKRGIQAWKHEVLMA